PSFSTSPDPGVHLVPRSLPTRRSSDLSSRVDPQLQNDGAVQAATGTLQLDGGSSSGAGSFGGAQGGTVAFTGGTFTLADGAKFHVGSGLAGTPVTVASRMPLTATSNNG